MDAFSKVHANMVTWEDWIHFQQLYLAMAGIDRDRDDNPILDANLFVPSPFKIDGPIDSALAVNGQLGQYAAALKDAGYPVPRMVPILAALYDWNDKLADSPASESKAQLPSRIAAPAITTSKAIDLKAVEDVAVAIKTNRTNDFKGIDQTSRPQIASNFKKLIVIAKPTILDAIAIEANYEVLAALTGLTTTAKKKLKDNAYTDTFDALRLTADKMGTTTDQWFATLIGNYELMFKFVVADKKTVDYVAINYVAIRDALLFGGFRDISHLKIFEVAEEKVAKDAVEAFVKKREEQRKTAASEIQTINQLNPFAQAFKMTWDAALQEAQVAIPKWEALVNLEILHILWLECQLNAQYVARARALAGAGSLLFLETIAEAKRIEFLTDLLTTSRPIGSRNASDTLLTKTKLIVDAFTTYFLTLSSPLAGNGLIYSDNFVHALRTSLIEWSSAMSYYRAWSKT